MRFRIVVSDEDASDAYTAIALAHKLFKARQSLSMIVIRSPKWLRGSRHLRRFAEERRSEAEDRAKWLLGRVLLKRYIHVEYALSIGLNPDAATCFVACPPQITYPEYGAVYTPSSYINVLFIPCRDRERKKGSESVLARFCYFYLRNLAQSLVKRVDSCRAVFEDRLRYYVSRGADEDRATRLALRDVARVAIGNVWLVWSYFAKKAGIIKRIQLPYHLAKNPKHAMIDPIELVQTPRIPLEELYRVRWSSIVGRTEL